MKKSIYLIIAGMMLLLASCAKTEMAPERNARTISFLTANYATKVGISGTQFPTSETFGVYAWTDGTTGPYFMDNEVVAFQEDELWQTDTPYRWPIDRTVDFFCFYPAKMAEITVDKTKVSYAGYDVEANSEVDVMYADKAAGFADFPELVPGSVTGYDGVPAVFHHALSKLTVDVTLAYSHKQEADGTVTDWEVTVNSVKLSGIHMKGGCELTLADSPEIGLVGWNKPEGNVWTPDASVMKEKSFLDKATPIKAGETVNVVPEMFVLPQALVAGGQKISLNITIKTKRNGADFLNETLDVAADFLAPNALQAWQMNHAITYRISVNPTRSNGNGGNPTDPSNPVDPNNPNLSDAVIHFDPAVSGWEKLNVDATINL